MLQFNFSIFGVIQGFNFILNLKPNFQTKLFEFKLFKNSFQNSYKDYNGELIRL